MSDLSKMTKLILLDSLLLEKIMMVNDEMMIVEVIELWRPLREGPWQGMPGQNNVLFKATLEECRAGQDLGNFRVKINYKIFDEIHDRFFFTMDGSRLFSSH